MAQVPVQAETPIDRYRSGNGGSANMQKLRLMPPSDVEVLTDSLGEVWVKGLSGGVSTFDAPHRAWSVKIWKASAGSPVPAGWRYGRTEAVIGFGVRRRTCDTRIIARRWRTRTPCSPGSEQREAVDDIALCEARRVLDDAVGLLPDARQRAQWHRSSVAM